MTKHIAWFAALGILASSLSLAAAQDAAQSLETSPLQVVSGETVHDFIVEFADEPDETSTGLMFRDGLADGTGMLFDFGEPRQVGMYMRNVSFSLDMLFLDTEGDIIAIAAQATPYSERIINPGFPVKGVLEIEGGLAETLGIKVGDRVDHALFGDDLSAPVASSETDVDAEPAAESE